MRAIYPDQRNVAAYVAPAEQTGLIPPDCLALGKLAATRGPSEALAWLQRAMAIDRKGHVRSTAAYDLDRLQRELLTDSAGGTKHWKRPG